MIYNNQSFGEKALRYFLNLNEMPRVPSSVSIINPYTSVEVSLIVSTFFNKYYNDTNERVYIFGINPGRFGGGITGIPFTDPAALEKYCAINSSFPKRRELSSTFIYTLINIMGGTRRFFSRYYLTALFPLALTEGGKNLNYYDKPELYKELREYIYQSVCAQIEFGCSRVAFSLGKKNALYLARINSEMKFFDKIVTLDHPRYIMQYKRKDINTYLEKYNRILSSL